jgi:tetratricopeptide (TPR) repeat protein
VDTEAFEEAAQGARRAGDIAAYRAALDLYAGDLLPGDRYEDWAESKRQELRRTYSTLLVELAALYEGRGDHGLAIEALLKAVSSEPTREEAHAGLMRLYASTGQRYQALRLYEQLQKTLRRELAVAPHEIARRIRQEILAGHVPIGEPSPVGPPPAKPSEAGRHNLSGSLTGFVGREREKEGVKRLLGTARVLDCLDGLAATAADRGRVERAVRLWGAIEARASPAATRSTVATATIT